MSTLQKFTLMELIIVVAIIALLPTLILPGLSRARHRLKAINCATHLKRINEAGVSYTEDFDDYFPALWDSDPTRSNALSKLNELYINDLETFVCKADESMMRHSLGADNPGWKSPDRPWRQWASYYGLNADNSRYNAYVFTPNPHVRPNLRVDQINSPGKKLMGADSYGNPALRGGCGVESFNSPEGRHLGSKANTLFCDGHVELVNASALHSQYRYYIGE